MNKRTTPMRLARQDEIVEKMAKAVHGCTCSTCTLKASDALTAMLDAARRLEVGSVQQRMIGGEILPALILQLEEPTT